MAALKSFIFFNRISQLEVADYLGVSKGQMSKLVSGKAKLQPRQLELLLNNRRGWNTEFLTDSVWDNIEGGEQPAAPGVADGKENENVIALLREQVEILQAQLMQAEERNKEYWGMIKKLTGCIE